jgi:hypothetical protein
VRKVPGFHDEPLSGKRFGQRSLRLSKSYRAFYEIEGTTARLVRVCSRSTNTSTERENLSCRGSRRVQRRSSSWSA